MSSALMHSAFEPAPPLPWATLWRNSQALALTVALHGAIVALLALGWTVEQQVPAAPSALKTRLVMMPAEPRVVPPPAEPLPVVVPPPVVEAKPEIIKPTVDPHIQARKLQQAALARKRVEEQKQEREAQQLEQQQLARQHAEQAAAQRQQALADTAANARRAQQAAADIRQYQPISKQAPDYPQRALDKGIEGDCTVEYSVNPQGKVEHPKVVGNCHPAFIRPSLAAAATFRYQPRVIDGLPVSVPGVRNTFHYRIQ